MDMVVVVQTIEEADTVVGDTAVGVVDMDRVMVVAMEPVSVVVAGDLATTGVEVRSRSSVFCSL